MTAPLHAMFAPVQEDAATVHQLSVFYLGLCLTEDLLYGYSLEVVIY